MASSPEKDAEAKQPALAQPNVAWHGLSADEAFAKLDSDRQHGLSQAEAEQRLKRVGPNVLPEREPPGFWLILLRQFKDPLIYVLLIAAVVSLATGNFNNAIFISAVLLLNASVGTFQERKAETSAQALKQSVGVQARVVRDGQERSIEAKQLVPGDVVRLEAGDSVPADVRLFKGRELRTDESLLTGESEAVEKDPDAEVGEETPLAERANLAHAGSSIQSGRAVGLVCRTGDRTELGSIARSLTEGEAQVPPLVLRLRKLTRVIALFVLGALVVLAALQLMRGEDPLRIFFLAVALAVSAIPAGLPVAITVALSIASSRMARRHVIVRLLPAVEGLGACTLIASDKTGTLTQNVLTVRALQLPAGARLSVSGHGYELDGELRQNDREPESSDRDTATRLAESAVLSSRGRVERTDSGVEVDGDAVDVAFLVLGEKLDKARDSLYQAHPEIDDIPFESDRRYAASLRRHGEKRVVHVKGAVEALLPMCSNMDDESIREQEEALAGDGFRVLAVARGELSGEGDHLEPSQLKGLELLGLVGLIDPTRAEVPEAVERCHRAGIEVRMITGDHPRTALSIARALGLTHSDEATALTGQELKELPGDQLARRTREAPVFARIEPSQKTRIVESLQEQGHFVAVTGDGANDAPALRAAHIGVAMGASGTDVARGAADLILTDDNFASVVAGVEEGRIAYDNVRKVTWLLLATGAGEVLLFFLALGFDMPLPLLPVQLLWLNLVTNGVQDVALAFEKGETGMLDRPPRPPDERVFNKRMIEQVLTSGSYIGAVSFGVFYYLHHVLQMGDVEARNLVLLLVVLFENVHIFSCRSETLSVFQVPLGNNPLLILAVVVAQGVHIAAMYIPGISDVLQMSPVSLSTWLKLLGIAVTLLLFDETLKAIRRWHGSGERAGKAAEVPAQ